MVYIVSTIFRRVVLPIFMAFPHRNCAWQLSLCINCRMGVIQTNRAALVGAADWAYRSALTRTHNGFAPVGKGPASYIYIYIYTHAIYNAVCNVGFAENRVLGLCCNVLVYMDIYIRQTEVNHSNDEANGSKREALLGSNTYIHYMMYIKSRNKIILQYNKWILQYNNEYRIKKINKNNQSITINLLQ